MHELPQRDERLPERLLRTARAGRSARHRRHRQCHRSFPGKKNGKFAV